MKQLFLACLAFILSFALAVGSRSSERDLYDFRWLDQDKKVYVLQNKEYVKKGSFYGDFSLLKGISSDYQDTSGFQLRTGHYFTEEWAFELSFTDYNNKNNATFENLQRINGVVPFMRKIEQSYGGAVIWAPFYGKINTFNKIFYFDWYFGIGALAVKANSNAESAANPNSDAFKDEEFVGAMAKTGVKFHASRNWHLALELQNTYFKAHGPIPGTPKKLNTNTDIFLGIGFSF
ncbi:MAG: hypothetical protein A2X86_02370 [Bdellovibrionales bacterium GWA2_49_15]|nr:MAG: hypothetical protein A2X86_02370 [Bdellovibrionales bacterium GWA2_49_15]